MFVEDNVEEARFYNWVKNEYLPVRPVLNANRPVDVKLRLTMYQVLHMVCKTPDLSITMKLP